MKKYFLLMFLVSYSFCINTMFVYASNSDGTIISANKFARVCADSPCTPALSGQINFAPTVGAGITAMRIEDATGVTGTAWGTKIGFITFPTTGANRIVINATTGALTGMVWAQGSGWINFSPQNYGVSINVNGDFTGWAWAGGANGGWIKFDCLDTGACVKTDWRPISARTVIPPSGGGCGGGGGGGGIISPVVITTPTPTPSAGTGVVYPKTQITETAPLLRADINDDHTVGIFDYNLLMVNWSSPAVINTAVKPKSCSQAGLADVNCDGKVDLLDFNTVMIYWGKKI